MGFLEHYNGRIYQQDLSQWLYRISAFSGGRKKAVWQIWLSSSSSQIAVYSLHTQRFFSPLSFFDELCHYLQWKSKRKRKTECKWKYGKEERAGKKKRMRNEETEKKTYKQTAK